MKDWIDFRVLKHALGARFGEVLAHYGLAFEVRGNDLVGLCPFHKERNPSCRVTPARGLFRCFGCGARGSVLDFVAKKELVPIKQAAVLLAAWFGIGEGDAVRARGVAAARRNDSDDAGSPHSNDRDENLPLAPPLRLDPAHPYLAARGLSAETISVFGLGYCADGELRGRIAIPIHDHLGQLIAYAGRYPGEPPGRIPRYRLPKGFRKSLALFNFHRVAGARHLVLVEGFFGAIRLHSLGIPAVAVMGSSLSARQENLLLGSAAERLTILMDGDEPGCRATREIVEQLIRRIHVRVADLPHGAQPDTLPEEAVRRLLGCG